jgi:hypothetical protein
MAIEPRSIPQIVDACLAHVPPSERELISKLMKVKADAAAKRQSPNPGEAAAELWHGLAEAFAEHIGDPRTAAWKMKVANAFAGHPAFPEAE